MSESKPITRAMKISDVKSQISSLVNAVYRQETRVLVEKAGIPVAALVSVRDLKRLARLDEQRDERWQVLKAMRAPFLGVPAEEIEREAAKAIAEVRAERRTEREAANQERDERFAVIDQMREAFKDVPPEEIERNVVAIIRKIREDDEAAIRAKAQAAVERRPA